ncbi:MAG: HD domain-containing phosphohydrolase [Myxococcaceae bacterium]
MDRVLVVDDDLLILHALSRILQAEGYEVVSQADPLKAAAERNFAVVITDFMMPNLNGIELLGQLKVSNPDAVRLMLTAAADFKVASDAVNRGEVFRILAKPWSMSELTTSVRQAVGHYHLVQENKRLGKEITAKNEELLGINANLNRLVVERTNGLLDGMISALDYRDTETQWHSRRVSLFSRRIAEAVGVSPAECDVIEQGALLHDIGKIGVRDSILLKPGPLTPEEWVEMRLHPEIGFRMLSKMPYLREASLIVHQHQERFDGKGYPQALGAESIVLGARIFCLADTMDAITTDRPYRKGRPLSVAKEEIARCRGSQFDPALVDAYLAIPDEDWAGIRRQVEGLEAIELKRWDGQTMIAGPGKAAAAGGAKA